MTSAWKSWQACCVVKRGARRPARKQRRCWRRPARAGRQDSRLPGGEGLSSVIENKLQRIQHAPGEVLGRLPAFGRVLAEIVHGQRAFPTVRKATVEGQI